MGERVVLDTSVIVKWFVEEVDSARANQILKMYQRNEVGIVVPEIVCLELINALNFGAGFNENGIREALTAFVNLDLQMEPLFDFYFSKLIDIMSDYRIAAYDAYFIVAAKSKQIDLITADKKHHLKEIYSRIKYLDEINF